MPIGILDFLRQKAQYFNPTSNRGQNFWSTPAANTLGNIQRSFSQSLPPFGLTNPQTRQNIKQTFGPPFQQFKQGYFNPQDVKPFGSKEDTFPRAVGQYLGGFSPTGPGTEIASGLGLAFGGLKKVQPAFKDVATMRTLKRVGSEFIDTSSKGVIRNFPRTAEPVTQTLSKFGKALVRPKFKSGFVKLGKDSEPKFIRDLRKDRVAQPEITAESGERVPPPTIEINEQDRQAAQARVYANAPKKGLAGMSADLKNQLFKYLDHLNNTIPVITYQTRKEFANLPKGLDAIKNYESGHLPLPKVKEFTDKLLQDEKTRWPNMGHVNDYLYHVFSDSPQKVNQVVDRYLSQNPGFTKERLFNSYEDLIKAGLTPKYTDMADILAARMRAHELAVVKYDMFHDLVKEHHLVPESKSPRDAGLVKISNKIMPSIRVQFPTGGNKMVEYQGNWVGDPELVKYLEGQFGAPPEMLHQWANVLTFLKNWKLLAGVPHTGLNVHGTNILVKSMLFGKDIMGIPGTGLARGASGAITFLASPEHGRNYFDKNIDIATRLADHGASFGVEDHAFNDIMKGSGLTKIPRAIGQWWSGPLFQKSIPAAKVWLGKMWYEENIKHMPEDQAWTEAAKAANEAFGGMPWHRLGVSRTFRDFMRATIFAPDYWSANIGTAKHVGQSLMHPRNPAGTAYRQVARNLMYMYIGLNAANHIISGHWMTENGPGHQFQLQLGYTHDGKKRYLNAFGTNVDVVKLPIDIFGQLMSGDVQSPVLTAGTRTQEPFSSALRFASGKDALGRPVPRDLGGVATQLVDTFGGQEGSSAFGLATGRLSGEEATARSFGIPLRYSGGATTKGEQRLVKGMQSGGATNEAIGKGVQRQKLINQLKDANRKRDRGRAAGLRQQLIQLNQGR